jgi:hypothetical protein
MALGRALAVWVILVPVVKEGVAAEECGLCRWA